MVQFDKSADLPIWSGELPEGQIGDVGGGEGERRGDGHRRGGRVEYGRRLCDGREEGGSGECAVVPGELSVCGDFAVVSGGGVVFSRISCINII